MCTLAIEQIIMVNNTTYCGLVLRGDNSHLTGIESIQRPFGLNPVVGRYCTKTEVVRATRQIIKTYRKFQALISRLTWDSRETPTMRGQKLNPADKCRCW